MSAAAEIRQLSPSDIELCRAMNALFGAAFEDEPTYAGAPPDDDWLARLLGGGQAVALVALDGAEMVGALVAYDLPKFEQRRSEFYIYDLAVAATHRRRGIATALIDALRAVARARGAWVIYVQADPPDAAAVALYDKLGRREEVLHFDIGVDRDGG